MFKLCGKSSTEVGTLIRYELIHSLEMAHLCKYCGKPFTLAYNLRMHELIHKSFHQASFLLDHDTTQDYPIPPV